MGKNQVNIIIKKVFNTLKTEFFEELGNKIMEQIQYLSKQIDFNNSTNHYKGKKVPKSFIDFKGPLGVYRSLKEGHKILEKEQKKIKSNINEIIVGSKKSEEQKSTIKIIKTLYKSPEKVIELFDGYYRIVPEAKYKSKHREALKILSFKQMIQAIRIALAQVKSR